MGPGSRGAGLLTPGTTLRATRAAESTADRLLGERIVVLGPELDDEAAHLVCSRLVLLDAEDRRRDVTLYVGYASGSPAAAGVIRDAMQWVRPDVVTVVHAPVSAAGLLVAAAGAPGRRVALPHTRFLLDHPTGADGGPSADVRARSEELARRRREFAEMVAGHCGRPVDEVTADAGRGRWFTPSEAVEYGIVDKVADRMDT